MTESIELPNHYKIKLLSEMEIYKWLGILEADTIKQAEIKLNFFFNTSGEQENYSKPNYITGISSNG